MSVLEYFCLMYFNFESLSLWQKKRGREKERRGLTYVFSMLLFKLIKQKKKRKVLN